MKKLAKLVIFTLGLVVLYSCTKPIDAIDNLKKSCLYDSKQDYFKKWSNTFTEIDTYNQAGTSIVSKSFIYPIGYFQLSSNSTYNVVSDGVPLSGTWDVNDSCKLVLDAGTQLERKFNVMLLSKDSLTLSRKDNGIMYIQHYVSFNCPEVPLLEAQWDNTTIVTESFNSTGVTGSSIDYPVGYFRLNADYTYNRVSDNVPLDGVWQINDACQLVLDKGTPIERTFDIQKLTPDSLIIWRKDISQGFNYLQKYKKH